MSIQTDRLIVPISFKGDTVDVQRQLTELQARIESLYKKGDLSDSSFSNLQKQLKEINKITNSGDFFDSKKLKKSIDSFNNYSSNLGTVADERIKKITDNFNKLKQPIQEGKTALDKFWISAANSLRYNLVNNFIDGLLTKGSQVIDFLEQTDKNLNDIRIVSGKTASEMDGLLRTANLSAKELGKTTNDYLKASQIYYQQGLATNEVMTRTNATLMAANVSGQNVAGTADQITAILNGFNVEASQTVEVLDKIAKVGAGTATDFEEIAKASQKVANSASLAGYSIDQTLGILATISSVTREAPESIGTSVNAIISKFNNLSVKEDEYTSKVENALKTTNSGLSIFDKETKLLKEQPIILKEIADKWDQLDVNQQKTITSAIAGTRQANRLMALLNNWDMYEEYTKMSEDSKGALDAQNEIYLTSIEAIKNQAQVAKEELYGELFNEDMLKAYYSTLQNILETITGIVKKTGGLQGIFTTLFSFARQPLMNMIMPSVVRGVNSAVYRSAASKDSYNTTAKEVEKDYNAVSEDKIKLLSVEEQRMTLTEKEMETYSKDVQFLKDIIILEEQRKNIQKQRAALLDRDSSSNVHGLNDFIAENKSSIDLSRKIENANKKYNKEDFKKDLKYVHGKGKTKLNLPDLANSNSYEDIIKKAQTTQGIIQNALSGVSDKKKSDSANVKQEASIRENKLKEVLKLYQEIENAAIEAKNAADLFEKDIIAGKGDYSKIAKDFASGITKEQEITVNGQTKKQTVLEKGIGTGVQKLFLKQFENADTGQQYWDALLSGFETGDPTKIPPDVQVKILEAANKAKLEYVKDLNSQDSGIEAELDKNANKRKSVTERLNSRLKGSKIAKTGDMLFRGANVVAGMAQGYSVVTNSAISGSEKITGVVSSLGNMLAGLPGTLGLVGQAVSIIGPIFIDAFGIGVSEAEKLRNKLNSTKETFEAFTQSVRQQASDLSSVENLWNNLAKQYQKLPFTYEQLTEEQQGQYDQVAEYVEKYAPELIKYYNMEGKAILDLSKAYTDAEKGKKSYLREDLEFNELNTYSQLTEDSQEAGELLLKNYATNRENVDELKEKISELNIKALKTGKDYSEEMSDLETQLAAAQDGVKNISSDWDKMVTKTITKGTLGFSNLDAKVQESLTNLASYQSYAHSDMGLNSEIFQNRVQDIITGLSLMSEEGQKNFTNLSSGVRDSILQMGLSLQLSNEQFKEYFSSIKTDQDFLSGAFLDEYIVTNSDNIDKKIEELRNQQNDLQGQLKNSQPQVQEKTYSTSSAMFEGAPQKAEITIEPKVEIDEEKVKEELGKVNELINSLEEQDKIEAGHLYSQWQESIRQYANSSAEAFNEVAKNFNEMKNELEQHIDIKADGTVEVAKGYENLKEKVDRTYAVLQGNNEEYYEKWKELNRFALNEIYNEYGIDADNYKTYNEYKTALDEMQAKLKVLYEKAAVGDIDELNKKLTEYKKEELIKQAIQDKNYHAAALMMAAGEEKSEEVIENRRLYNKLEKLKEQLQETKKGSDASVQLDADTSRVLLENGITLNKTLKEDTENTWGTDVFSAVVGLGKSIANFVLGKTSFKTTVESSQVSAAIAKINKKQGELNTDLKNMSTDEDYADALNAAYGMGQLEQQIAGFSYNVKGGYDNINLKTTTKPQVNNTGSVGSGKEEKEKEVADLKFDLDPLKKYIDKIEKLNHDIEILRKEREKLYGKKYIDSLNKEAEINREILKTEEAKLGKIKEISSEYQKQLIKQGVKFGEGGLITNYNEILKSQETYVNSLSGEEKEAAKKRAENLKSLMDEYEKYALEAKREAEKSIQEIQFQLADLARERIEYPITLILEASEKDKSYLELIAEIQRFQKGKINFSVDVTESANNLINSLDTVKEIFSQTGDANKFLNSIFNDPDLKDNVQKQLEMIATQQENMQTLASDLINFSNQIAEAFANGLEEAVNILDEELSKYNDIISQYEYILDLANKLNVNSIEQINTVYGNVSSIYQNNIKQYKTVAKSLKEARDQFTVGTEEWIIANEKYMMAQANTIEQEKKLAEVLSERFDSVASQGRKDLEKLLFNGSNLSDTQAELEKMQKERQKYLDTERKIYELNKLERDVNKDIKEYSNDPKAQNTLKKFMNDELKYLNSKKKLTQDDLDLTAKQYAVVKARIDLERAYNNEQYTMMLQRNADGSFGYMYVQNTDAIEEAEQAYLDAIDALYVYSEKRVSDLQSEAIDYRKAFLDEYDKIVAGVKNGTYTQEEAMKRLKKAADKLNEDLKKNAEEQTEAQRNMATAGLLQILGVTEKDLGDLTNTGDSIKTIFDLLDKSGNVDGLSNVIRSLGLDSDKYVGTVGEKMQQVFEDLGGDKGAMKKLMDAFSATENANAATVLSLLAQTTDLSNITAEILENSLNGSGEKFKDFIDEISAGKLTPEQLFTEDIKNGLDYVGGIWDNLQGVMNTDLEALRKEFDMNNPDGTLKKVSDSVIKAYGEYSKQLKNFYNQVKNNQEQLDKSTKEYNKHLQTTVNKVKDEITRVASVTKEYTKLRAEILNTISKVKDYIKILDEARKKIEQKNKPNSTASSGSKSGNKGNSSSNSSNNSSNKKPTTSRPSGSTGNAPGQNLGIGKAVKIVRNPVYTQANGGISSNVYPSYFNSNRRDLFIDGYQSGKYRVKLQGGGYIGWFNPNSLQAFHKGGKIDVNKEGLALVKKNEAVFTEQEVSLVQKIKDLLTTTNSNIANPIIPKIEIPKVPTVEQNVNVNATFPNVTQANEIEQALESLYVNSAQYIDKN